MNRDKGPYHRKVCTKMHTMHASQSLLKGWHSCYVLWSYLHVKEVLHMLTILYQ